MRSMRWFVVAASVVVLLANGVDFTNARFGDWLAYAGFIYAVFLLMMLLEILARVLGPTIPVMLTLILVVFVPFMAMPWITKSVQSYWPEGKLVVAQQPSDFQVETFFNGNATRAVVRNTSEHLIENVNLKCDVFNTKGEIIEVVKKQIGEAKSGWVQPGGVAEGKILSASQYSLRKDANPNATKCAIDYIALVQK